MSERGGQPVEQRHFGRLALPSHGTVIAYVALFIALGGVAYGVATIGPGDIKTDAVRPRHINEDAVRSKHINEDAVRSEQIKAETVTGEDVDETTLETGGVLTVRFIAPDTGSQPTTFGPVSGFTAQTALTAHEGTALPSPSTALVARDMYASFDLVSAGSARRLALVVNGAETALACEVAGAGSAGSCAPAGDPAVPVPANATLSWKTDRGSAGTDTTSTFVYAAFRLTEG